MEENMSLESHIADLEQQRQTWVERRSIRVRDSSAYKRMTARIHNIDKKLGYLRKCAKQQKEREHRENVRRLVNGSAETQAV